jgi:hypothetical protein
MIDIHIDMGNDLTVKTVTGKVSVDELIDVAEKFYSDQPTRYVIWNLIEADGTQISPRDIETLNQTISKHSYKRIGGKTALVVSRDYGFGMSRMYQANAENHGINIKYYITRDMDDAMRWINSKNQR